MVAANHAMKSALWKVPVVFSAVFLGYLVIVFTNLPPIVRSNHVSVNWNMLFIAGAGALGSVIALVAVLFGPFSKRIGKASATLICVEAGLTLILSTVLLYRSLGFFGIV